MLRAAVAADTSGRLTALYTPCFLPQATLSRVVTLLSREMSKSFADSGADLPPWRTTSAMLARWQLPAASGAGLSLPAFGRGTVQVPQPVLPTPESKAEAAAASAAL